MVLAGKGGLLHAFRNRGKWHVPLRISRHIVLMVIRCFARRSAHSDRGSRASMDCQVKEDACCRGPSAYQALRVEYCTDARPTTTWRLYAGPTHLVEAGVTRRIEPKARI